MWTSDFSSIGLLIFYLALSVNLSFITIIGCRVLDLKLEKEIMEFEKFKHLFLEAVQNEN